MAAEEEVAGNATPVAPYIRCFWCMSNNVGDALTPWLVKMLTGRHAVFTPTHITNYNKILISGSMLNWAKETCVVWGAGLANPNDPVYTTSKIRMVRGPLSRAVALHHGAQCPDVVGDPGLLAAKVMTFDSTKTHDIGIVPHYLDQAACIEAFAGLPNVKIIDVFDTVERVLMDIAGCRSVVSSSLHGLVFADALGVKSVWGTFKNDDLTPFKFHDHLMAVGVDPYDPIDMTLRDESLRQVEAFAQRDVKLNLDAMLDLCPFKGLIK